MSQYLWHQHNHFTFITVPCHFNIPKTLSTSNQAATNLYLVISSLVSSAILSFRCKINKYWGYNLKKKNLQKEVTSNYNTKSKLQLINYKGQSQLNTYSKDIPTKLFYSTKHLIITLLYIYITPNTISEMEM